MRPLRLFGIRIPRKAMNPPLLGTGKKGNPHAMVASLVDRKICWRYATLSQGRIDHTQVNLAKVDPQP